jgi:hypothetical protein
MRKLIIVLFVILLSSCLASAQSKSRRTGGGKSSAQKSAPSKADTPSTDFAAETEAERILRRFTEAMGEPRALRAVQSYVMHGVVEVPTYNVHGTVEEYMKRPDKKLLVISIPGRAGQLIQGRDGKGGWGQTPLSGFTDFGDEGADSVDSLSEQGQIKRLRDLFSKMKYNGKTVVNGREAHVVEATPKGGRPQVMYFDTQTGMIVRVDNILWKDKEKNLPKTMLFEGYANVQGVAVPTIIREIHDKFTLTIRFYEVKFNVHIEDSLFERPKAPNPDGKQEKEEKVASEQ